MQNVIHILQWVFLSVAVVLLLSASVLILNTIRMAIFARRREVSVMKSVGATNWFIRLPFMVEGLVQGLLGSAVAVLVVLSLYWGIGLNTTKTVANQSSLIAQMSMGAWESRQPASWWRSSASWWAWPDRRWPSADSSTSDLTRRCRGDWPANRAAIQSEHLRLRESNHRPVVGTVNHHVVHRVVLGAAESIVDQSGGGGRGNDCIVGSLHHQDRRRGSRHPRLVLGQMGLDGGILLQSGR